MQKIHSELAINCHVKIPLGCSYSLIKPFVISEKESKSYWYTHSIHIRR